MTTGLLEDYISTYDTATRADLAVKSRYAKRSCQRGSTPVIDKKHASSDVWKCAPKRPSNTSPWSKRLKQAGTADTRNAGRCGWANVPDDTIVVDIGENKEVDLLAAVQLATLEKEGGAEKFERMDPELSSALDALKAPRGRVESSIPGAPDVLTQYAGLPHNTSCRSPIAVPNGSAPSAASVHKAQHTCRSNIHQLLNKRDITIIHGRSYTNGNYWAPNDEKQENQLDIQHHLYRLILGGQLYLAPIGENPRKVLDIGTGTGIWAVEFADQHPSAQVIGFDLSPVYKARVTPNVSFEVKDAREPWDFEQSSFDFIHARGLNGCVSEWPIFYKRAFASLTPGGWYQQIEMSVALTSDDGSVAPGSILDRWGETLLKAGDRSGRDFRTHEQIRGQLETIGFEDVKEIIYTLPVGSWSEAPCIRDIGRWNLAQWDEGIEGWSLALFTRELNWSYGDVEAFLKEMRKGLRDPSVHAYHFMNVVYGRKPERTGEETCLH